MSPFEFWREKENAEINRTNIQTINAESTAKQYVCITTEKQITVKTVSNFKTIRTEEPVLGDNYIVKADKMTIEGK